MTRSFLAVLVLLVPALLVPACGSDVSTPGGSGAGGATSSVTASIPICMTPPPLCADECGSDYFPEEATCVGDQWVCPPGTVNPDDCPPGTCWGPPLSCEVCGADGWECQLTPECVTSCGGIVCAVCPPDPGPFLVGPCQCECDAAGQTSCALAAGCCQEDMDCGDFVYVPCVNNVCKESVPGKCWTDAECLNGTVCIGATVCPCNSDCPAPDQPGDCLPPP